MTRTITGLLLLASVAAARSMEITDFRADLRIRGDASVEVTERIVFAFRGKWNGVFRYIPDRYDHPSGARFSVRLSVLAVEDGEGTRLKYERRRKGDSVFLKVWVPGAHDAERTVVIRYRLRNVLMTYGEMDELYWNVTGNGWPVPIRRAEAHVELPPGLAPADARTDAFTGRLRARGGGFETSTGEDGRIVFRATDALAAHEGLTIVAGFPVGHVVHPSRLTRALWFLQDNWSLLIPLAAILAWIAFWWWSGRDRLADTTVVAEYEAPFGLTPAEVGVVADEKMHRRDVTACMIDLAVRGYIAIREEDDDHVLTRRRKSPSGLKPYEREVLDALFPSNEKEARLSARGAAFHSELPKIERTLMTGLVQDGFFLARPDKAHARGRATAWAALVGLVVLGFAFAQSVWYFLLLVPAAAVFFTLSRYMAKRRAKGLEALRRARGMEEYLSTAERERMRDLPKEHFETLLPFAIALGLQNQWTRAFEGLYDTPPEWYAGGAGSFTGSLRGFTRHSNSALAFVPRTQGTAGRGSSWSGGWSGGAAFPGRRVLRRRIRGVGGGW